MLQRLSLDAAGHRRTSNLSQTELSEGGDDSQSADIQSVELHSPSSGPRDESLLQVLISAAELLSFLPNFQRELNNILLLYYTSSSNISLASSCFHLCLGREMNFSHRY